MNDPRLPRRLAAAEPGWTHTTDVVVVGSGIAGLSAALHARAAGHAVTVVTKVNVEDGSTRWAQGGIAAALDPADSPAEHEADTLAAGVGLCDEAAVRVLVQEGPDRVRELIALGAAFDRDDDGGLSLTREGGHHRNRIIHAGGDATGAEVQRALERRSPATRASPWSSTRWSSTCSPARTARRPGSRCTSSARAPRTAWARCWPGPWSWPPAGWARSSPRPPTRPCRPGTASPWRCGPARW